MDWKKVIIRLLGLQDVVLIDAKLFEKDLRAEIVVEVVRSEGSCCAKCQQPLGKVKEWFWRKAKVPPMGIFNEVKVKYKTFRGRCKKCDGNRQVQIPWLHFKHKSMTAGFVEIAGRLMEETTCEATGRLLGGIHSMQMMRVDQTRMGQILQSYKIPDVNYSSMRADEIHFKTIRLTQRQGLWGKRWNREWITNLVSVSYNKKEKKHEGKVLFNAVGRGKAFDKTNLKSFRQTLANWYRVVRESKLEPFLKFAKTIRKYRKLIENYIISRLTTAVSEGLNNKIKALKRAGYGYSSKNYFRNKILQRCG